MKKIARGITYKLRSINHSKNTKHKFSKNSTKFENLFTFKNGFFKFLRFGFSLIWIY